jgi:hypothetical protein
MARLNAHCLRFAPAFALAGLAMLGMVAGGVPPLRPASAQGLGQAGGQAAEAQRSQAQLEQMLAPLALYPDDLLMQLLMAATYPLEIVQAARWLGRDSNAALSGDALAKALEAQPWDPSVKSLVPFPEVLKRMNEQLEWTQALGDAVLAQQEDVFNAIQVLRGRAQAAGKLESGPQQVVNVAQNVTIAAPAPGAPPPVVGPPAQVITIAPAQPDRVYVPVNDPGVVFGPWPWPGYPPVYTPPPPAWGLGSALLTGMAFATGTAIVGSLWGWARPGWGRGSIDIDVNRVNTINVNRNQITANRWQHDVTHRHGVAYANPDVRNRFQPGGGVDRAQAAREEFRGRTGGDRAGAPLGDRRPADRPSGGLADRGPVDRPGGGLADRGPGDRPGGGLGDRRPDNLPGGNLGDRRPHDGARPTPLPAAGNRPAAGANRPAAGQLPSGRPAMAARPAPQPQRGPDALQGLGQGGDIRAAQQRGQASRQAPISRPAAAPAQRPAMQGAGGGHRPAAHAGGGGRLHR